MILKNIIKTVFTALVLLVALKVSAWEGSPMPGLHVEGRYLKDAHGNIVNLHGFAQTYSPWFNEMGKYWNGYDVNGCLSYNKGILDEVMAAGWKANFIRMHMDPYWSNNPGQNTTGENDISAFNFTRFKKYLDEVFVPMAEYIISKGMYVVMRPPGVCPGKIAVGDAYNQYLIKVWGYVAQHPKLKNHPNIMFELANEPVDILGPDGTYGAGSQGHFDNLKTYFQTVVDTIRASADNIIWAPGLGYQSLYQGYAVNPIEGKNIGYALHVYPGWFNSGNGYDNFQKGWDSQVKPVADFAPIVVTEMDWAPEKYNSSWGKEVTGIAGGSGFGANFKKITDESGNVSWLIFTGLDLLAKYTNTPPAAGAAYTFLNDPEACPWPTYHWYQDYAQKNCPKPDFEFRSHSDNGDGTYTNPVIFADFPDPDVIRVGDVYYMSTTTMHVFPGATILKSNDLVNWEYCSNPLEKIESSMCYNLDGCNRYSHGQWASSLKYKDGTFYLHFNTLDEGSYLLTATNPEGTWTKRKLVSSFYDAGLFFDDDGKTYIVSGINNLRIAELDADFKIVKDQAITYGTIQPGIDNAGTEGSHLYKINGYYYIYATTGGYYATQVAYRSKNIFGPYDEKEVFNSDRIHQGALIQTQTGEWWTMLFADKGAYGRLPSLQPVTWADGWPMVGVNGKGVTTFKKPNVDKEYPISVLPTNDNFRNYQLGMQWGWNHNPDNSKWSLTDRPDYLRLKTVSVVDSLVRAKNTLTQRIFAYPQDFAHSYGTIKLNIMNMMEGDVAGLAVFQKPYSYIGIKVIEGQKKLIVQNNKNQEFGITVADSVIYLRAVANYNTSATSFYFSTDNITYTKFGSDLNMKFDLSVFTGNKFCLFNFATIQTGGFVDIDWFSTEKDFTQDKYFDNSFVGYSTDALTLTSLLIEKENITLLTGSTAGLSVKAVYANGRIEDVSIGANYVNSNPDVVQIINGQVIAKVDGEANVTVSYKGLLGDLISKNIKITSTTFPLVSGLLNPSIYAQGTFNETTQTLITGQWGFGGWWYTNGLNLSGYKYLVAKLGADNKSGISFRIFDENNYWSKAAEYNFESNREVVVTLSDMYKAGTTTKLDPSHIYIVGFWSSGNSPIVIDEVFLSNTSGYDPSTSVRIIPDSNLDESGDVDVYTIMGVRIRSKISREQATQGLPNGLYIVGRQKVLVANYK
jgi:beta-xylosidase